jgi:predicted dehydrogenase
VAVRVGVIGVGYLGQHHARIFSGLDGVELMGVADTETVKAGEIAEKYGCKPFADYTDLVGACDALSIVTPTTTHHAIAMVCLNAGKDLLSKSR